MAVYRTELLAEIGTLMQELAGLKALVETLSEGENREDEGEKLMEEWDRILARPNMPDGEMIDQNGNPAGPYFLEFGKALNRLIDDNAML